MKENKTKNPEQPREIRKERFEFVLTVNGFMICQRYFKINNYNEKASHSFEVLDAVRNCGKIIDNNLRNKSEIYVRHMAPLVFDSEAQMRKWFKNEKNVEGVSYGSWIIIRGEGGHEFVWKGGESFIDEGPRKDFNEFVDEPEKEDVLFKFTVIDNGYDFLRNPKKLVIGEVSWDGSVYPRFIRNGVDLSNGKGRYDNMDISTLSHEMSLYYWCNKGQPDLVPVIVAELRAACSDDNDSNYTVKAKYGDTVYSNLPELPGPKPEYPYVNGELSRLKRG